MWQRIVLDLVGGAWSVLGLLYATVVLGDGPTKDTMTALFLGLTAVWLITGPLRWRD